MKPGILLAAGLAASVGHASAIAAPKTVASIGPIHSLVGAAMAGAGEPALLLPTGASPHTYALRPSEARLLAEAELIVWVGEELETFLRKPLSLRAGKARIVTLIDEAGLELHVTGAERGRDGDHGHDDHDDAHDRDDHRDAHGHDDHRDAHDHGGAGAVDPHIWLDPGNARRIVAHVAAALAELDPPNAQRYRENAESAGRRLAALDAEIRRILAPVRTVPYVVFHDAYGYFERRYGVNPVGAITLAPERPPGARRLAEIRRRITATGARCVFGEPQFTPALLRAVLRGTGARSGILDPLGAATPGGIEGYAALLSGLAHSFRDCLS